MRLGKGYGRFTAAVNSLLVLLFCLNFAQAATPPVKGSVEQIAAQLRDFAEAGLDEAILVVTPITEESIRALAPVVAALA